MPRQFYNDLAWGGLTHNEQNGAVNSTFTSIVTNPSDRSRILEVIRIEQTGIDNDGEPVTQKGASTNCI